MTTNMFGLDDSLTARDERVAREVWHKAQNLYDGVVGMQSLGARIGGAAKLPQNAPHNAPHTRRNRQHQRSHTGDFASGHQYQYWSAPKRSQPLYELREVPLHLLLRRSRVNWL